VKNRIILIMGTNHSGKSICAKSLSEIIGGEIVDLDELIKKQTGKTPRELFVEGHVFFKKAEARALASVIKEEGTPSEILIITAGGGIIDNDEAMALISEARLPAADRQLITVYLEISAETEWQCILDSSGDGGLPPLINTSNPKETHLALHNRRAKAFKAAANITLIAENRNPKEVAGEIAERLSQF